MPQRVGHDLEPQRTPRAEATRRRVLDTARVCVAELGPLGATSNEIARRAGVSWGVIQYHFGTREGILLATIEDSLEMLLEVLDGYEADLETITAADRIALVADAVWHYCSQPEYLVSMDVLRLLSHDAASADEVDAMLRRAEQKLTRRMNRLLRGAVADDATLATARSLIFAAMRGLALKRSFTSAATAPTRAAAAERRLLVRALQLALTDGR
jgi:TetR/AcrR family transcriptional regulator, regulator of cefoperazone and chloramphenicol sensitivity